MQDDYTNQFLIILFDAVVELEAQGDSLGAVIIVSRTRLQGQLN